LTNKILFLDLDGVLNNFGTPWAKSLTDPDYFEERNLFPELCGVLNVLLEHYKFDVVISSSQRKIKTIDEIKEEFKIAQCTNINIIDMTPNEKELILRGEEINAWIVNNNYTGDYSDMLEHQLPYFVKIDARNGLTFKDLDSICNILNLKVLK
jgi:hypothetical protein